MLAVANENQGKPIAFIAVNSGKSHADVAKYLRRNKINWPTIVDSDRGFEKTAGVGEISLKNIWQVFVIDPDGKFRRAGSFKNAVEEMSKTAELEKRAELAKKMNDMVVQSGSIIPLIHRGGVSAHANTLVGVKMNEWDSELWNAADWSRKK